MKLISDERLRELLTLIKNTFVKKENGKGLSTNDYTTTEKNKLSGIEENAQKNQNAFAKIGIGSNNIVSADWESDMVTFQSGDNMRIEIDQEADTITFHADIPEGGVQDVKVNGTSVVENGIANIPVATKDNFGAVKVDVNTGMSKYAKVTSKASNSQNYSVFLPVIKGTSASNLTTIDEAYIPYKEHTHDGLMSSTDKTKLDGIEDGAEVNVFTSIEEPTNKGGISYNVWKLNDKDGNYYYTPKVTSPTWEVDSSVLPLATTSNKGAMSSSDKTKLDGIEENANNYTHPSHSSKTSGLYKITVDAQGHVSGTSAITKDDITDLGIPAQDTTYKNATANASGLMSASDKTKLNGIEEGANKNFITGYTQLDENNKFVRYYKLITNSGSTIDVPQVDNGKIFADVLPLATTDYNGAMSSTDKAKLDSITAITDSELDEICV